MKITKYLLSIFLVIAALFLSCEDREIPQIDIENSRAIAGFSTGDSSTPRIVFNPAQDIVSTFTVSVSTLSDSARSVVLEIGDQVSEGNTILDPIYYEVSTLNPVIEAGEFITTITVTTINNEILPAATDVIPLNLISIEGAEILQESESELQIGLDIECPSVELPNVIGTAISLENELLVAFGGAATDDDPRTIIAGPGDNQITIIGGLSLNRGGTDVILTIDPETGFATEGTDGGDAFFSGGTPAPTTTISGNVLTCINRITFNVGNSRFGGANTDHTVTLEIQ